MNVQQILAEFHQIAEARDWSRLHTPKNLAMALTVEVGELLRLVQWRSDDELQGLSDTERSALGEELADIQMYLVKLSDTLGVDLGAAVESKMASNRERHAGHSATNE